MASYEPIAALLRGLEVLHLLNESGPMSVGEIHAHTGITKPTVVRVLETLAHAGYIDTGNADRRYAVTARVLGLSNGYEQQTHLLAVAGPIVDTMRRDAGWPVEIGVFDSDAMVILDTSRQPGHLSINRKAGSRVPVLRTALGRAYLAALSPAALAGVIERLARDPAEDFDLARRPAVLAKTLKAVQARGYGFADKETLSNGRALACAILQGGAPVASVNIVVHASALTMEELEARFGKAIQAIAARISQAL